MDEDFGINPQLSVYDYLQISARKEAWYDDIWKNTGKCVFCDLKDKYIVYEKNNVVLTANIFPYVDAHLMIIPRRHIVFPKEFSEEEWKTVREMMYLSKKILKKAFKVSSIWFLYREGKQGQSMKTVDHLHIHAIPYKEGLFIRHPQPISWAPKQVAAKLRQLGRIIKSKSEKFEKKYSQKSINPTFIVEALILNKKGQILLGRKRKGEGLYPDSWILIGGRWGYGEDPKESLRREIKEETGLIVKSESMRLVDSRIEGGKYNREYSSGKENFLFNSFIIKLKREKKVKPGDDIVELNWFDLDKLAKVKISPITKRVIKRLTRSFIL